MFQVVVLPPSDAMRSIEEFRRTHDPSFHRIAAHVALVPPFETANTTLVERFDALRGPGPFEVAFGAPATAGRTLCLPVTRGDAELRALQSLLCTALLGPLGEPPDSAPTLRAGLFSGDAELELARRVLSTLPAPEPFVVNEVVLLLEDVRGLWHTVRARRFIRPRE